MSTNFSLARTLAIFIKEFQQMLRDRPTFAMAVGVPVLQLVLFGYAINTDPKGLPTAVVSTDTGPMSRSLLAAMQNTGYFRIVHQGVSEGQGEALVADGEVQFLVVIPPDFSQRVVRGEKPALLVSVDATDPSAAGNAIAALGQLAPTALRNDLTGPLQRLQPTAAPFELLTINWTSYVWAVVHGQVLETALGYFIAPLGTVTVGVLVLHEQLRTALKVALVFAAAAVVVLTISYGRVP